MMNMVEEAIIYATILHQGKVRKTKKIPSILHPLEVAQILATMTDAYGLNTLGLSELFYGGDEEEKVVAVFAGCEKQTFNGPEHSRRNPGKKLKRLIIRR